MYAVELDRSKRLLVISAAQKVTAEEAKMVAQRIREVLQDVAPGFRVLADFRGLQSMDSAAARHIAKIMDALAEKNVASVTRSYLIRTRTSVSTFSPNSITDRTLTSPRSRHWPMRYKVSQPKPIRRRINAAQLCFLP